MIPPLLMSVRIVFGRNRRGIRLWLPLFVIWAIACIPLLLLLPFMLITDFIMALIAYRFSTFQSLATLLGFLAASRGLLIDIRGRNSAVDIHIALH